MDIQLKPSKTSFIADDQEITTERISARPFVKWVGGKRSILPLLIERLPESYNAYHECFVGGGALFFELQPDKAVLADVNFHLTKTYQAIKTDVEAVIKLLKHHTKKHNKTYYLAARELLSEETDTIKIAAWFIYLNKTCYNGLYRANRSGKFNVPMGSYKNPAILDEENLRNASHILQTATIQQQPFQNTKIKKGAFYYLDPPYHKTYDGYNGQGFGDDEHQNLAALCHSIDKAGGYFMLSNSNTEFVKDLYKTYNIEHILASRSVSCKSNQRGKENELLIRNYE